MRNRAERRRRQRERNRPGPLRIEGAVTDRACRLLVTVKSPRGFHPVEREVTAVVDTGCTKTSIREDIAKLLGLPVQGELPMETANGRIRCKIVLAELQIGSMRTLAQLAVPPMRDEMLFGMDMLAGGVLVVDLVSHTWEWNLQRVRQAGRAKRD